MKDLMNGTSKLGTCKTEVKDNDQWKGSRLRCLLLTGLNDGALRTVLLGLIHSSITDFSIVLDDDFMCYPKGYKEFDEVRLGQANKLISPEVRRDLNKWWLGRDTESSGNRDTPNWDFACRAKINSKDGLILVEAKAHKAELWKKDTSGADPLGSLIHIKNALKQANDGLNNYMPGFKLQHEEYYQFSNRFAWSWKLASLGIPVVLVYLGFLKTYEMRSAITFEEPDDWHKCVEDFCFNKIPAGIWNREVKTGEASFYPILRSLDIQPCCIIN